MCTVKSGESHLSGLSGRLKVTKFTSYIFGGFVMSSSGQFKTSNDLVIVQSMRFTNFSQEDDDEEFSEYGEVQKIEV